MDDRQDEFRVEGATNLTGGQLSAVEAAAGDPARLETLYQSARASGAAQGFAAAIESAYAEEPANVLYGAWHYRLLGALAAETPAAATSDGQTSERTVWQWRVAIPLSILLGFVFWVLSAPGLTLSVEQTPAFVLIAPPLAAAFLIGFLAVGARAHYVRAGLLIVALVALTVYVEVVGSLNIAGSADLAETYQYLAIIHLPVVAWGLVGLSLLGLSFSASSVFAFLTKSIEAIGTGGVFAIAGGIFVVLTVGLFQTLNINLDETVMRLLLAGGAGLIPLVAVSAVYDTSEAPERQEFRRGFGKILAVLMQALLALSLVVMLIYILVIPFNFSRPIQRPRDADHLQRRPDRRDGCATWRDALRQQRSRAGHTAPGARRHHPPGGDGCGGERLCARGGALPDGGGHADDEPADDHRLERDQHCDSDPAADPPGAERAGELDRVAA